MNKDRCQVLEAVVDDLSRCLQHTKLAQKTISASTDLLCTVMSGGARCQGVAHRVCRWHPLAGGPGPLELVVIERLGDGRTAALEVWRLVRWPRVPLPLLQRGGRTQQRGCPLELPGLDGDGCQPIQGVGDHPPVAPLLRDLERLPGQLLGTVQVAELPL